jgi:hypothetical protein
MLLITLQARFDRWIRDVAAWADSHFRAPSAWLVVPLIGIAFALGTMLRGHRRAGRALGPAVAHILGVPSTLVLLLPVVLTTLFTVWTWRRLVRPALPSDWLEPDIAARHAMVRSFGLALAIMLGGVRVLGHLIEWAIDGTTWDEAVLQLAVSGFLWLCFTLPLALWMAWALGKPAADSVAHREADAPVATRS